MPLTQPSTVGQAGQGYWSDGNIVNGTRTGGDWVSTSGGNSGGTVPSNSLGVTQSGWNLLNQSSPRSGGNSPGTVPQVYPGSTGGGSNQNVSTGSYGGYTPGPAYNFGSLSQNAGGNNQFAAAGSYNGGSSYTYNPGNNSTYGNYNTNYTPPEYGQGGTKSDSSRLNYTGTSSDAALNTENSGGIQAPINPITGLPYGDRNNTNPNNNQYNNQSNNQGLLMQYLNEYRNLANTPDNEVTAAQDRLNSAIQSNAAESAAVNHDPNLSLDTMQGMGGALQDRFSKNMAGYQASLSAAQTKRQQQLDTYGNLIGATGTHFNGYVGIDPVTGQPVGGQNGMNNAINFGANADAYQSGVTKSAQANQVIQGVQNITNSVTGLLSSAHGLNGSTVNAVNQTQAWIDKNLSNSDRATLNASLQSIGGQLSNILGYPIDIGAISTAKNTSIVQTINNLIQTAKGISSGYTNGGGSSSSSGGGSGDPLNIGIR